MTAAPWPGFGGSEMGRLMAALDWVSTPLGAPESWSTVLRATVRMMLASKQQMVLFWGPQYVAVYNDSYFPVIGAKHPGALGRPVREHWGELLHVLLPLLDRVVDSGEAFWAHDHPFPLQRHGFLEQTYFDISYDPVPLEDGRIGGVLCLVTDTTGRVLSQRRMRTLSELGVATAGTSQADQVAGSIIGVLAGNPEDIPFAQAYLVEAGVLRRVASTLGERDPGPQSIVPDDGTRAGTPTAELLETGKAVSVPAATFLDSGVLPDIETALVLPITSGVGVDGMLVAGVNPLYQLPGPYHEFYDVLSTTVSAAVANALAHERERRRVAALAELDRAKTEFFSNVSHEFRTPLTLIAGPIEDALADQVDLLPAGQRSRLEIVRRNTRRLGRLVDDLLDFARIEGGRYHTETVAVDLVEFTRGIAESFAPAIVRAGLSMHFDCPPSARPVVVDPDMWEKIVLNLLSNALKYTHDGRITVALRPRGDQIELTVTDTGVGIPADQLPLLFHRFHRVRGATGRSHEGAGIGLALVHELTKLLDGEVAVDSREGQGSTFTVRLPFGHPEAIPTAARQTSIVAEYLEEALQWTEHCEAPDVPATAQTSAAVPTDASVLIAEDNADLRKFLATLLEPSYTVISTADGRAALQAVAQHQPDLVLADVMMPVLDGFGLLAALRGNPRTATIPVVLLSARAGAEASIEGLAAGADDYLVKPFTAADLLARVRSNLELARLRSHESAWRIALINALQDGFVVATTDGTVIELNDAFTALLGYSEQHIPCAAPHPWWPDRVSDPDAFHQVQTAFQTALTNGEGRFTLPLRHRDGHRVWAVVAVASVRDRHGERQLFVCTLHDVTAEHLAAERRAALARFTERIVEAHGVREVLDAGLTEFRDTWTTRQAFAVCWGCNKQITLVTDNAAWAAVDSGVRAAITAARRSGEPQPCAAQGGIAVPIETAAGSVVLWLECDRLAVPSDQDWLLLTGLRERLAQALARARVFDDQRSVAITLQRAILGPTDLPPGFAVRYEPAAGQLEVGGDWYDVIRLAKDRIGVVVGDCVGRGVGAAAVMGQLRSACRALLLQPHNHPGQVLAALDDFAGLMPEARCTTVFCATIDLTTRVVRYSSAGHPPGLLVHADGGSNRLDAANSVPLAGMASVQRPDATVTLRPGSTLLLYTDGLVERRGEPLADGIGRARDTLLTVRGLAPEPLANRLAAAILGDGHEDDVAYVIYQHPHDAPEPFAAELIADPRRLSPLRYALRAWLATALVSGRTAEEIVMAVNEACSNAIEHADDFEPGRVSTITGTVSPDGVEIVVSDHGRWKPPGSRPASRGRGFLLMNVLMDDVTITHGETGTTIRLRKRVR